MDRETLLVGFVRDALVRMGRGESVRPEELCAEHPELIGPVADALGLRQELPLLHGIATATDPLSGTVLGDRYELAERLGQGAMGVVYAARDRELGREVAVKIFDGRVFQDPSAEQRFLREAELVASLGHHEHLIAVHDRGRTDDGLLFLVMERLVGTNLAELLEAAHAAASASASATAGREVSAARLAVARERLATVPEQPTWERLVAAWGADLARGLAVAHAVGVVHRDVKPSNIFLCRDGRIVLLDFGIAARDDGEARLTATATTLGTPWYMAPEQATASSIGPGASTLDVYGLCATLFHLLTGRPPFEGEPHEVLVALAREDAPAPRDVVPDLPLDLQAIVEHGMAREPERRYADAGGLADDLDAFLDHRPVAARPLSRLARRWRRLRRSPARFWSGVAALVVFGSVGVVTPVWAGERARARADELAQLRAGLPSLLAVEGQPSERLLDVVTADRAELVAVLDRILALDERDFSARLWRAALRLDAGETAGAARDLGRLAAWAETPYLRAVADRYAQAAGRGALAVDVRDVGAAPSSVEDHYVAGFHALRLRRELPGFGEVALEHLDAAADELVEARDLRLIALLAAGETGRDPAVRRAHFERARTEALALERIYGRPTARTLATRGAVLVIQKRYADAVPLLEASLELRPARHGPLNNLGVARRRLGDLDGARTALEQAHALRPHLANTVLTMAQVHRDRRDFAAARDWGERLREDDPLYGGWRRAGLLANIALHESAACREAGDGDAARDAARAAEQHGQRAVELATDANAHRSLRARLAVQVRVAAALHSDDLDAAVQAHLESMLSSPDDAYQLANLAELLPADGLGEDALKRLRLLIYRLAPRLVPGDEKFADRMSAAFRELLEHL